jgi:hypothetical protein
MQESMESKAGAHEAGASVEVAMSGSGAGAVGMQGLPILHVANEGHDPATASDGQGVKGKKELKSVPFKTIPPSHYDEMTALVIGRVRPPAERPAQLALWRQEQNRKATRRSLREAWAAVPIPEQHQVLARYCREVVCSFELAPKKWVNGLMHGVSKKDDPQAHAARLAHVKRMWCGCGAAEQHKLRDEYLVRKPRHGAASGQQSAAPLAFLDAGHSEADWSALVAASKETPGTAGADGKSVFDWVELQRLASVRDGHQTTENVPLLAKAVEGVDTAHVAWKQRRKWTNKALPDAFREGEWSGKQVEWECMNAVQQQAVLEGWCKRVGHVVPRPTRLSDTFGGNRGLLKERRIKPLKRLSDLVTKHRSRGTSAISKLLMRGHRSIEIAFGKFQSKRIQRDLIGRRGGKLLPRQHSDHGAHNARVTPGVAAKTAQYLNQPRPASLCGESSSSRDGNHAFLPAVEPTCAGVFSAILHPAAGMYMNI